MCWLEFLVQFIALLLLKKDTEQNIKWNVFTYLYFGGVTRGWMCLKITVNIFCNLKRSYSSTVTDVQIPTQKIKQID